jgi:hypothetical protein
VRILRLRETITPGRTSTRKPARSAPRENWAVFGVEIVIVKSPDAVPAGTLPGLNDAVARSGNPEADRLTGLDRLPCVWTTKEKLAELPETMVWVVALLDPKVKSPGSCAGAPTVNSAVGEVLDRKLGSPE